MVVVLLLLLASVVGMSLTPLLPQIFFPSLVAFGISWAALYIATLIRMLTADE